MPERFYTRDNLPDGDYQRFMKTYETPAVRIDGTFYCVTSEGNTVSCTDGWLAVDSSGYPYPINDAEFRRTYTPVPREN